MADLSPEASRRRRIVYHGCRATLTEELTLKGVALCDREFPPPGAFSVQKFLEKFCELYPAIVASKGTLFKAMILLRPLDGDLIGADPLDSSSGRSTTTSKAALPSTPPVKVVSKLTTASTEKPATGWIVVFDTLFQELVYQFLSRSRDNTTKLKLYLQSIISKMKLSPTAHEQLRGWFLNPTAYRFTMGLAQSEMHSISHQVYLWTCEQFGPIEADRIFSKALSECDKLPEATQFPPRGLL